MRAMASDLSNGLVRQVAASQLPAVGLAVYALRCVALLTTTLILRIALLTSTAPCCAFCGDTMGPVAASDGTNTRVLSARAAALSHSMYQ